MFASLSWLTTSTNRASINPNRNVDNFVEILNEGFPFVWCHKSEEAF